jgi:hypothetical protein
MANILGRNDRRRRVLNEEALSASTAHLALRRGDDDDSGAANVPRYSERAGIEHHPQITDFIPRRFSTLGMLAGAGLVATAVVEGLHWYVDPHTTDFAGSAVGPVVLQVVGGVEGWLSAVVLLMAAAMCVLIYSLRRHRIDDFRGRYRVWLGASVACLAASVDSVAPLHSLLSVAATEATGWTALRAHSAWWMAVVGLPATWIAVRTWLDARESRLAATALAAAFTAYGGALGMYLANWPIDNPRAQIVAVSATTSLGTWMLLVGVAAYARFVVLDAQGLVTAKRPRVKASSTKSAKQKTNEQADDSSRRPVTARAEQVASSPVTTLKAFRQEMKESKREDEDPKSSRWVDGRRPVEEDYSDEDGEDHGSKLSKSDRKRLRKLKAQNRAA